MNYCFPCQYFFCFIIIATQSSLTKMNYENDSVIIKHSCYDDFIINNDSLKNLKDRYVCYCYCFNNYSNSLLIDFYYGIVIFFLKHYAIKTLNVKSYCFIVVKKDLMLQF